jgi:glycosyltransferase involved in cell wall biosynthesis/SAM-dependent methyltransferase
MGFWGKWKGRSRAFRALLFHHVQLARLRLDRHIAHFFSPGRIRILAYACWKFPIYSQTFVYQELTQLIQDGFEIRFLYSKLESRTELPAQFDPLWHSRRRLELHPAVIKRDYQHYAARMPDKIDRLVHLLSQNTKLSPQQIRSERHFLQAFAFTRLVEAYGPDYLHSYFFYEGSLFALFASFLLDIPRGVSCYADHMLQDYALKALPVQVEHCNLIIATSKRIKQELLELVKQCNPNSILVKANAINAIQFPANAAKEPKEGEPFRIVSVSRIEPKKGLVYLAEAARKVKDAGVNVFFHVIGQVDEDIPSAREYADGLKEKITTLDIADVFCLEGKRTEDDINRFFRRAQLFAAPFIQTDTGDKDGIPTALLEGMAAGLPIVATDAGSIGEVVENGRDGVLVPQRDADLLADAILQLIQDPKRRDWLSKNAARKIREKFDVAVCERPFHDRLRNILLTRRKSQELVRTEERKPLVSVIIIFYNAEKFFQEAINSVISQSYDRWELLLVDDGSTDSSTEIARACVRQNPDKVRYLEHDNHRNLGMSPTRNLGIRNARGDYIAFLDSDDVWLPDKLQRQVAILESQPRASMLFGSTRYWYSWTGSTEDVQRDYIPDLGVEPDRVYEPPDLLTLLYPLAKGTAPCPSDLLIRTEKAKEIGAFEEHFSGQNQMYEDSGFLTKMYLKFPVFISSECWDKYRIHPDSCFSVVTKDGRYHEVRQYFLNWFESYLQQNGIKTGPVWNALQASLSTYRKPQSTTTTTDKQLLAPAAGVERIEWGTLRRLNPVSLNWGFERGMPIDRYFIESFLSKHSRDIAGHTLEIEDDMYTRRFGGDRTTIRDVLHVTEGNPRATLVGDLSSSNHLPSDTFDCIVITQTLHLIYDIQSAVRTLHRILKPGGVLLATFPGITRISQTEWSDSWYWNFTSASTRRLFGDIFRPGNIEVQSHGNVLTAVSFLHGFATEEFKSEELDYNDPNYEVLITVRAVK